MNKKRPEGHELTAQYIGRRIKALGFKTRRVHGRTEVLFSSATFQTFLVQFGLSENSDDEPPEKTLPNATTLQNPTKSKTYSGRELVGFDEERQETLPITLPDKREGSQEVISLVESGRVSGGDGNAKKRKKLI